MAKGLQRACKGRAKFVLDLGGLAAYLLCPKASPSGHVHPKALIRAVPFEEKGTAAMDRFDNGDSETPISDQLQLMHTEELLTLWERSQKMTFMLQAVIMQDFSLRSNTEDAIIAELMRRAVLGARSGGIPGSVRRKPLARRHS